MSLQVSNQWIKTVEDDSEPMCQSDGEESPPNSPCEMMWRVTMKTRLHHHQFHN